LTVGNIALKKEHSHLETSVRELELAADKSRFNWIFMKLPNCTKKRETRATLYTFKIMSHIKREMKLQNNRLGKIGDHSIYEIKMKG